MATQEETLYSVQDATAWITLNRPESRNALSAVLVTELYDHLVAANNDSKVRSIVITGSGTAFCAGADLKAPPGETIEGRRSVPYPEVLTRIQDSDKPVITAVNGYAFAGGLGLVGASDISIAVDDAIFSFSEVRIGVIPAVISVVCVPKLGTHHATKLFITGERFTGAQAVKMGFVHRAVPADQLRKAVEQETEMIKLGGPNAVANCKRLVREVPKWERDHAFAKTAEWSGRMFRSEEGREGAAAFREKRSPRWVTRTVV